eukprot:92579-Rhodomonas_salina.1
MPHAPAASGYRPHRPSPTLCLSHPVCSTHTPGTHPTDTPNGHTQRTHPTNTPNGHTQGTHRRDKP